MGGICKKQRDYTRYNEELILQGVYLIDPAFIDTWDIELNELNKDKIGGRYQYPGSLVQYSAILHAKNFKFRQIEGVLRDMSKLTTGFPIPSFSQIRRRILELELNFEVKGNKLEVGVDGSGMKPATRGDWIRKKWKVRRGWIKVVAMGDIHGNIIDIQVGEETLDEQQVAREMIEKHAAKISIVYLDGLHDTNKTFNICAKHKIKAVIKIRSNASPKGLTPRGKAVREYQAFGYEDWRILNKYGYRWPAT